MTAAAQSAARDVSDAETSAARHSPYAPCFAEIDGHRMHYVDEGSGDVVLMVHGNPTWSFYYRNLVRALSTTHRCIVPDHIGCGLSDRPADADYPYSLARRASDLGALVERVAPEGPIDLVVHDWGGMIGMTWAREHAARIRRIVVLNTGAFPLPETKRMPWQLVASRLPGLGAVLVRGLNGFCRYAARHCFAKPVDDAVKAGYLAPYDSWRRRIAVHRFVQDIPLRPGDRGFDLVQDVDRSLAQFADTPMLIAWGMRDFVFDHHFLDGWTARFPAADVHRFDDAGHYVLEDAGDRIIPLVERFLGERGLDDRRAGDRRFGDHQPGDGRADA